jgi:hypothetical protein
MRTVFQLVLIIAATGSLISCEDVTASSEENQPPPSLKFPIELPPSVLDTILDVVEVHYKSKLLFSDTSCFYEYTPPNYEPRLFEFYTCEIKLTSYYLTETDRLNNKSWVGYASLSGPSNREYIDSEWGEWKKYSPLGIHLATVNIYVIASEVTLIEKRNAEWITFPTLLDN